MSNIQNPNMAPGYGTDQQVAHVQVTSGNEDYLYGNFIIDSSVARDPGNTISVADLRAGTLMGKITASEKYAPAIIGLTTVLHDTSAVTTVMTLPAAIVTEIQRRVGASGTFKINGPPTANGTIATETVTYSAIASATTITITATSADFAVGSLIQPTDGSESPVTFLDSGTGIRVTDNEGANVDAQFPQYLVGGIVISANLANWSSDTSVQAWVIAQLNAVSKFVFDSDH